MDEIEHIKAHDDLNRGFDSGSVFTASTEEHERYLRALGSLNIKSDEVRSKGIIRALVINHLQMSRTIGDLRTTMEQLNRENGVVAKRVLILTWMCAIFGAVQAFGVLWAIFHSR
ncbi:MAG TPA: hypothetical protein VGR14_09670 [Verrucomicrobiae bacterium]|nr:hypothetical protein [Verrucomicrobiae bacterium]